MGIECLNGSHVAGLVRLAPVLLAGSLMSAATINLNTGAAAWTGSGPNVAGTVAVVSLGTAPNGVWLPAPAGSQWVSTQPNDGTLPPSAPALPGVYTFEFGFATPGLGGSLDFAVAADNQVTVEVFLDGVLVAAAYSHPGNALFNTDTSPGCAFLPAGNTNCSTTSPPPLTPAPAFGLVGPGTIGWGAGGVGAILIRASVLNSIPPDPSPVGFLLTGSADVVTPEPATYAMLGFGLALIGAYRRRRK